MQVANQKFAWQVDDLISSLIILWPWTITNFSSMDPPVFYYSLGLATLKMSDWLIDWDVRQLSARMFIQFARDDVDHRYKGAKLE